MKGGRGASKKAPGGLVSLAQNRRVQPARASTQARKRAISSLLEPSASEEEEDDHISLHTRSATDGSKKNTPPARREKVRKRTKAVESCRKSARRSGKRAGGASDSDFQEEVLPYRVTKNRIVGHDQGSSNVKGKDACEDVVSAVTRSSALSSTTPSPTRAMSRNKRSTTDDSPGEVKVPKTRTSYHLCSASDSDLDSDDDDDDDFTLPMSSRSRRHSKEFAVSMHRHKKRRDERLRRSEYRSKTSNVSRKGSSSKTLSRKSRLSREERRDGAESDATDAKSAEEQDESTSPTQESTNLCAEPIQLSIKALPQRRRRSSTRRIELEYLRNHMTGDELSILRMAFVKLYPVPPSNLQAQSRYEQQYGTQMPSNMVKGLWEMELKPWSDRWWQFYTQFNDVAREKKKGKREDRDPTVTKAEAERWAKEFHQEKGDARLPRAATETETPSASQNSAPAG